MSTLTEKIVSIKRRQICQRVNNPGTAPTTEHLMLGDWSTSLSTRMPRTAPTTEHLMLGDWSPSLSTRNFKDCTDHRALDARGLVAQFIDSELQRLYRPPST